MLNTWGLSFGRSFRPASIFFFKIFPLLRCTELFAMHENGPCRLSTHLPHTGSPHPRDLSPMRVNQVQAFEHNNLKKRPRSEYSNLEGLVCQSRASCLFRVTTSSHVCWFKGLVFMVRGRVSLGKPGPDSFLQNHLVWFPTGSTSTRVKGATLGNIGVQHSCCIRIKKIVLVPPRCTPMQCEGQ